MLQQNVSFHGPSSTINSRTFWDIRSIDMAFHQYDSACEFSNVLSGETFSHICCILSHFLSTEQMLHVPKVRIFFLSCANNNHSRKAAPRGKLFYEHPKSLLERISCHNLHICVLFLRAQLLCAFVNQGFVWQKSCTDHKQMAFH